MKQKKSKVKLNLNTDQISEQKHSYHHGKLKCALIEAGENILVERGVDGFSLREAARRAGVSAGAPAHHFGDARGLLTAIAARAFEDLAQKLRTASLDAETRDERIHAQSRAYVDFARENSARFRLMWRETLLDQNNPDFAKHGLAAFRALQETVEGNVSDDSLGFEGGSAATYGIWSLVHGYAELVGNGVIHDDGIKLEKILSSFVIKD